MTNTDPVKPSKSRRVFRWLRKKIIPLAGLLTALAIFTGVGVFYLRNPDVINSLEGYGYAGAFVISVVLNATIIIPVSNMTVIAALGGVLGMPWLVGVLGGVGAGIGEMSAYIAGRSGRELIANNKVYLKIESWVKRWGWIAVFFLSIFPLVFDFVGIIAGAMRMPVWKFMVATWLGRTISYVVVAYFGKVILDAIPWFS
jgi:uncharacterized membrane protein YdjX (TVP38/TMEM64 family)